MSESVIPRLIIVMGVSGCGKSTVAAALAAHFDYEFLEADDFHPVENREHMAAGKPLTDAMREPWIDAMQTHLKHLATTQTHCVMSFSGLRAIHRERIKSVPMRATTLHLEGKPALILERVKKRTGHFMPSLLLDNQFQTLEPPNNEANTHSIDIDCSLDELITRSTELVRTEH